MSKRVSRRIVRVAGGFVALAGMGALLAGCNLGAAAVTYPNVPGQDVAVGDINGDGNLDVVTVGDPDLGVLLGDGTGHLSPTVINDGVRETCPTTVALADVDGDSDLDLIRNTTCLGSQWAEADVVRVQPNNGNGGFGPAVALPDIGQHHIEIVDLATGDVNGDGAVDIVANYLTTEVAVFLGDGAGVFTVGLAREVPKAWQTQVVDIDSDGDLDLVSAGGKDLGSNNITAAVMVQRGDGTGAFGQPEQFLTGDPDHSVEDMTIIDLDQDGRLDVVGSVTTGDWEYSPVVLPGAPGGGFGAPIHPTWEVGGIVMALESADVDSDGFEDLVAARTNGGVVLFSDGAGDLVDKHLLDTQILSTQAVATGDLDGNGQPDLIFAGQHCEPMGNGCIAPSVGVMLNLLEGRPPPS